MAKDNRVPVVPYDKESGAFELDDDIMPARPQDNRSGDERLNPNKKEE